MVLNVQNRLGKKTKTSREALGNHFPEARTTACSRSSLGHEVRVKDIRAELAEEKGGSRLERGKGDRRTPRAKKTLKKLHYHREAD